MRRTSRADGGVVFADRGNFFGIRSSAKPARYALRLVVAATYVGALLVALQLAGLGTGVSDEPAQAEPVAAAPPAPPPERPESVPTRIPEWAWGMYRWHDDRQGHVRPIDAPQALPRWYWEWREWRKELAP